MAAPTIAGGHGLGESADDRDEHDRHVPQPPADRAEVIDELAARLAAIESKPRPSARSRPSVLPRPRAGEEPTGGRAGESGRRRGAEPGGHPEDAPGDPEAVAKAICLRLLTGAARPRAALETALRQRGIPDDVADRVLSRFVEVGLIDDKAYAEAFVAAKHRERALGVTALRTELRRKGVDDQTVDAAVQAVDRDAERDRAKALISRRVDAAMSSGAPTARRRLVGLLARRGYSVELACRVVDEALAEYGAEEDRVWSD